MTVKEIVYGSGGGLLILLTLLQIAPIKINPWSAILEWLWKPVLSKMETLEQDIIAILENALCTSGFEHEGKNKDGAAGKYTFESYAEFGDSTDKDTLPWHIYYPKASTTTGESNTPKES